MRLEIPPDLEALINKRIASGAYKDAQDVLRQALEAQDAEERLAEQLAAHIQEGYNCAGRAELIDSEQLHHEINRMKESWRKGILPGQRQ